MSDAIELMAWRFLAQRRCPGLAVAHVEFVDGLKPTLVTPAEKLGFYESASGRTFGEAAVDLAFKLGMRCTDSAAGRTDSGPDISSAATAADGESASNSPRIPLESADSTTDATGVERSTATGPGRARRARKAT